MACAGISFIRLTENGKYSGIFAEEYNGMYLGLGHYIISGTIKMEHSKPKEFTIHGDK